MAENQFVSAADNISRNNQPKKNKKQTQAQIKSKKNTNNKQHKAPANATPKSNSKNNSKSKQEWFNKRGGKSAEPKENAKKLTKLW